MCYTLIALDMSQIYLEQNLLFRYSGIFYCIKLYVPKTLCKNVVVLSSQQAFQRRFNVVYRLI